MRGDVFIGKVPRTQNAAEIKANYGELSLQLRTAKSALRRRLRRGAHPLRAAGRRSRGLFIDLREAYVNAYLGPFDLRLGQQIIVWGRADALNPTNNLTPVDFRIRSPIEDDIRLGNVGARAFLRLSPVRLEGVWMPIYLPTELPPVGLPQLVAFGPPTFPSPRSAERARSPGACTWSWPSFEMSVSYLRGYAPLPGLTLSEPDLRHDRRRRSSCRAPRTTSRSLGFDFSTALGDVATIRGEAAYRRPFDYQNRPVRGAPRPAVRAGRRPQLRLVQRDRAVPGPLRVRLAEADGHDAATPSDSETSCGSTMQTARLPAASSPTRSTPSCAQINQILFSQTAQRAAHRHAALRVAARARDAVAVVAGPLQLHHPGMAGHAAHRLAR